MNSIQNSGCPKAMRLLLAAAGTTALLAASPGLHARTTLAGLQTEVDQNTAAVCDLYASLALSLPLHCPSVPKVVFVTSGLYNGNLGGVEGADQECQAAADAVGLAGVYKAWIADSSAATLPANRFTNTQDQVSYVKLNGVTVADNWSDLTDVSLDSPIDIMETGGQVVSSSQTWSNVNPLGTGQAPGAHCGNWTATGGSGGIGFATATSSQWTIASTQFCGFQARLYCFEQ